MNAIETYQLKKSYDGSKFALDRTSFEIGQGEIFGFLGPNGSGKTTTVRLLNGILAPTDGSAAIMGKDILNEQAEIHKLCGVMTETALMYENLTGAENLKFFGKLHGMTETAIKESSDVLLKSLELVEARDKNVKTYSTGMKRRLSLARALLHGPKVLFLDEPTSGLDPESAMNVTKMIKQLSIEHGVTVFLCTHQLKYAEEICTLYGFIHNGSMLGFGTFDELLKQKNSTKYLEIRGEKLPQIKLIGVNREVKQEVTQGENQGIDQERKQQVDQEGKLRIPIKSDAEVTWILQDILDKGGRIYEARQIKWDLEDLYFSFQKGERS